MLIYDDSINHRRRGRVVMAPDLGQLKSSTLVRNRVGSNPTAVMLLLIGSRRSSSLFVVFYLSGLMLCDYVNQHSWRRYLLCNSDEFSILRINLSHFAALLPGFSNLLRGLVIEFLSKPLV